ncbi:DUF397 domain-containing protein [Streptomyces sp. NPDC049954]|uniref:DUF397 domain-containing protein n=1 Tax=Streptomyces sp. NPDC049954 TaxID=3155779 RepID=UPI0034217E25
MSTTPDYTRVDWTKSTYSGNGGDSCLEWAPSVARATTTVPVRDSKTPRGPVLTFSPAAFTALVNWARQPRS